MKLAQRIIIFGIGKSGTTALFYRIKHSLPPKFKTLFEPRLSGILSDLPPMREGILAKVLLPSDRQGLDGIESLVASLEREFSKRVLLIRDPRDILVSIILYTGGYGIFPQRAEQELEDFITLLRRKEESPSSLTVSELVERFTDFRLFELLDLSLAAMMNIAKRETFYQLRYEDMIRAELSGLEAYLGFPVSDNSEVATHVKRVERTKGSGDWRNWFTESDIALLRPKLDPYLRFFGYDDTDWRLNEPQIIPKRFCSEYFCQLVLEKRRLLADRAEL